MKRARREAVEQQRRERARAARRTNLVTTGIAVVVILVVAGLALRSRPEALPDSSEAPKGVVSKEIEERNHIEGPVDYPDNPPMGGNHAPVWQNCGFYDDTIIKEQAVHSLEHGAVWVTYDPSIPQEDKDRLEQMAQAEGFLLVSAYDGQPSPIVATGWGRQLDFEEADDPDLARFVSYFQVGPQTPEPGAPCTGGTM